MKAESLRVQSHLFKQGAPADRLYIIVSGQANVRAEVCAKINP